MTTLPDDDLADLMRLAERLERQACDCRPSRQPHGVDAIFPEMHEEDCAYRRGREAAALLSEFAAHRALVAWLESEGAVEAIDEITRQENMGTARAVIGVMKEKISGDV